MYRMEGASYLSTLKATFTLARNSIKRSPWTFAVMPKTSTPVMPFRVFAASSTALRTASSKLVGELPTNSITFATVMVIPMGPLGAAC